MLTNEQLTVIAQRAQDIAEKATHTPYRLRTHRDDAMEVALVGPIFTALVADATSDEAKIAYWREHAVGAEVEL